MTDERQKEIQENAKLFLNYLRTIWDWDREVAFEDIEASRFLVEDLPEMDRNEWLSLINSYLKDLTEKLLETNICPSCGDTIAIQEEVSYHPYGDTEVPEVLRYYQCESCRETY